MKPILPHIVAAAMTLLVTMVTMGIICWVRRRVQQALHNTCNNVSQEIPGLTMHMQVEWIGDGKSRKGIYHIDIMVSGNA